ncbi:MAG: hypothetical protein JNL08_14760 [Planctomycetes bacterium]|nr:hypothetical protein [Planctomycetota bacterium]
MHHHRSVSLLVSFGAALLGSTLAAQTPPASPADRGLLEGSSFTHFPLGRASARMQTLHADLPAGTLISGHAYRRDATGVRGLVAGFASDLQVTLSMSPNLPTQASTTFANNVGPNPVVVLPRTFVAFPATNRPALDPAATFELVVPYQTPFLVPAGGGTVCVDVEVFGNQSASGTNQNLSVYLDAHELYTDGRAEQPGFRTGAGCEAPGQSLDCFAQLTLWRRAAWTDIDVSIRNGVPDAGGGTSLCVLTIGAGVDGTPIPWRTDCPFWSTAELWVLLSGSADSQGDYDGTLTGLPLLPPGLRLWCQAGTIDALTGGIAASDANTLVTPPPGVLPIPVARVVNSSNVAAATGTFSFAVPVMAFL